MKLDSKELMERLSTSRREFNATAFSELDRNLSDDEREEWNAIYASFSSRSLLRNTVIGLESIPFPTDDKPEQVLTCMVVMRHLVKVLIPLPLFWIEPTGINPNSVIGADVDYIIIGVDREGECAIAARSLALEQQRWHALNVQHVSDGDVVSASVLACGPTRITVTACGFDVTMGQQAMSYTYLADMREEYHAGQQLQAKVLSVSEDMLALSVRDVGTDPYLNAELRHPVGSSRIATISSKYAGGVFCRLIDGCTVVCRYAQQFSDDEFRVGDKVMQVRNNYEIVWNRIGGEQGVGAYNGDIGIVESINMRDRSMVVRMDDRRLLYPAENLNELEIAYAITVHKSQGSEFPAVILPVAQVPPRLCYRNLFYTGVTRARRLCVVAGRRDVVNSMMSNIRQNLRYSGLCALLQAGQPSEQLSTEGESP